MKNLKAKVFSSLMAFSIIIPSTMVKAYTLNNVRPISAIETRKEYNATLTEKRDTIRQNRQTNQSLRQEIQTKKSQIKHIIKTNKAQYDEATISKIKSELESIKAELSSLSSTKGTVSTSLKAAKEAFTNKDYNSMETQLDNIISTQQKRTDILKQIDASLTSLLTLVQNNSSQSTTSTS